MNGERLKVHFDKEGRVLCLDLSDKKINFKEFKVCFDTDFGLIDCNRGLMRTGRNCYAGESGIGKLRLKTNYSGKQFAELEYSVVAGEDFAIKNVILKLRFRQKYKRSFLYNTFKNASTFVLSRFEGLSLFTGFCNPIFDFDDRRDEIVIRFECALKLKKGECFVCDKIFMGLALQDGVEITPEVPITPFKANGKYHTRYRNPSGYIALQRSEIRAFKRFAYDYLNPFCTEQKVVFYTYFSVFPRLIESDEDEETYYRYIDNFKALGGDIIIFNPIERFVQPVPTNDSRWIIAKEGTRAAKILKYCRENGIGYGFTWGSAVMNTNSPMTSYSLIGEKNQWKKIGKSGELGRENCLAFEDFYQWFKSVQVNTIREEKIALWDWDPGPGIASFCYSTEHGHIPGKGLYKGFRNAMRIIEEIKKSCPDLKIQSFHGLKEYGLWGLKGIDWHESYWEQDPYFLAASYPDFSADRYTADGMRMQCWWNHNFRFLPSELNQFMAARMIQNCFYPSEYRYLFDFYGYKYSLLSAIACGGAITFPMLPFDFCFCSDYFNFVRKWLAWGKEHYSFNRNMFTFGAQVSTGGIDGYAKWNEEGTEGYIFLFNPAPFELEYEFEFGDEIGFEDSEKHYIEVIYPAETPFYEYKHSKNCFARGDVISLVVAPYSAMILHTSRKPHINRLYSVSGKCEIENGLCKVFVSGIEGSRSKMAVDTGGEEIGNLIVNGKQIPFRQDGSLVFAEIVFGEDLPRYITCFENEMVPIVVSGKARFEKTVNINGKIRKLLDRAAKNIPEEMKSAREKIEEKTDNEFLWTRPDRLFATVCFEDIWKDSDVFLSINGKKIALKKQTVRAYDIHDPYTVGYYADISESIQFDKENHFLLETDIKGQTQFYGIQLYYLESDLTTIVSAAEDRPLVVRAKKTEKVTAEFVDRRKPEILNAWIREGYIEEYEDFTLVVDVNIPRDELEGVYCSNPINIDDSKMTLMADGFLEYDLKKKVWFKKFYMGSRQFLIVDEQYISIYMFGLLQKIILRAKPLKWNFTGNYFKRMIS